jgi:chromosome segregation ATPase
MADENIGFFKAVWRFFTFYKLRKSLGLIRAADRQFTTSAQGIEDAGTIKLMNLQKRAKEFLSALAGLENAIELKKSELTKMRDDKKLLIKKRNGAAAVIEKTEKELAAAKSDEERDELNGKLERAMADGKKFSADIKKIEADEPGMAEFIALEQKKIIPLESQLKALNQEIKDLPAKTQAKAAQFLSNQQMLEAYKRMNNLNSPLESDPMDAVDKMLAQQNAEVKVAGRIAVNTTDTSGTEYLEAGDAEAGDDEFDKFLKSRKTERDAKTGETPDQKNTEERPRI